MLCMEQLSISISLYWLFEIKFTTTTTTTCLSTAWHIPLKGFGTNLSPWCWKYRFGAANESPTYKTFELLNSSTLALQWRHNGRDSVSNHQPHDCLLNCLFRRRWKKTSKLRATGLCAGNSPVTGEFPAQMASNAENVSIWWRQHVAQIVNWMSASLMRYALSVAGHCRSEPFLWYLPLKPCPVGGTILSWIMLKQRTLSLHLRIDIDETSIRHFRVGSMSNRCRPESPFI